MNKGLYPVSGIGFAKQDRKRSRAPQLTGILIEDFLAGKGKFFIRRIIGQQDIFFVQGKDGGSFFSQPLFCLCRQTRHQRQGNDINPLEIAIDHGGDMLHIVDQVGAHEDGAAAGEGERILRIERKRCKFLREVDAQPHCLLLNKGTGSCRADLVHVEVSNGTIFCEPDELGILTTDLDDGVGVWATIDGAFGLGGDLVDDQIGADRMTDQFAAGTGDANRHDIIIVDHAGKRGQRPASGFQWASAGEEIGLGQERALKGEENGLGADGTNIEGEDDLPPRQDRP